MGTPKVSPDPIARAIAVVARRLTIANILAPLFVLGGVAGGAYALLQPSPRLASQALLSPATTTPTAAETVVFHPIRVSTQTPTRMSQTSTVAPTLTLTPFPSSTPSMTPSPTPSPVPPKNEVTRLLAPAIKLDTRVVTVGIIERYKKGVLERVWEVAKNAAGYHGGTALPGHVGNTVISGHNNVNGAVFASLYKLEVGDDVYVYLDDIAYHYQVSEIVKILIKGASREEVVENLHYIMPKDDERLTLVTCWPPWTSIYRLIVICRPVSMD